MRLGVISDIHGSIEALKTIDSQMRALEIDILLAAGDFAGTAHQEFSRLLSSMPWEILAVQGNCDAEEDGQFYGFSLPHYRKIPFNRRNILLTHGHIKIRGASAGLQEGDIFVSGHTHIPCLEVSPEGIILMNPGSAVLPRENHPPSFGLITDTVIELRHLGSRRCIKKIKLS